MRVKLHGLQPNVDYAVQLRVSDTEVSSPWSRNFSLATIPDPSIPAQPANFSFASKGTGFLAKWDDVETNVDGSDIKDLSYYEVTISDGGTRTVVYKVKHTRYEFSFEDNLAVFGSPVAVLTCSVRAVDTFTNNGVATVPVQANNSPPMVPTSLVAVAGIGQVALQWTPTTDDDIDYYKVYQDGVLVGQVFGNSYIVQTASSQISQFNIGAVDVFGQESPSSIVSGGPHALSTNVMCKFAADLPALTSNVEVTVTHNLGSTDVGVWVQEKATGNNHDIAWRWIDANSIGITSGKAYAANALRVVVVA